MNYNHNCPFCDGNAVLLVDDRTNTFRKDVFQIKSYFYKCEKCKEEFTTTELDEVNITQVYNQYRELHNIPSSEQFKFIRERYRLSASKMSLILGIGQNQYALYESGEIPNESNSQLISLISNPGIFKEHLLKRKSILQPKEFSKILEHLDSIILEETERFNCLENFYFNPLATPSALNGFKFSSFEKFANMVIYFLNDAFLVTRLNKYMFYADFLNFKRAGFSISGYNYAAISLGPVPQDYKTVYDLLEERNFITTEPFDTMYDEITERFVPLKEFNNSIFSEKEIDSLKTVKQKFAFIKTKQIIDMSHEEIGWIENHDNKSLIDYQKYGFLLKHF